MKTIILVISIFIWANAISQITSYKDVAVIVNDNSQTSIEIASYFQIARNIPEQNMIHVIAPTTEEIDSVQFAQIRNQIENHLISLNIVDSINYLVTTKGIPLRVNNGCNTDAFPQAKCSSFDSELALILGVYSNYIGVNNSFQNPIYNTSLHPSHEVSEIYLVTRLDGYSKSDIIHLIDNSGPFTGINQFTDKAIVDISNSTGGDSAYFAAQFTPAYDYLINNSWNADLDLNFSPFVNQSDVFGYFGIGHGPLPSSTFNYEWTKGSVGAMSMCNSAFTFETSTNSNNDFLIADLIADGCTGALGHIDYIFYSQIWDPQIFVARYLDINQNFNLAESYYMSEKTLSWQTVIIGDPKASVIIDNLANLNEPEFDRLIIYPNPSAGIISVNANDEISSIAVFDMKGILVKRLSQLMNKSVDLDLSEIGCGVFLLQVDMGGDLIQQRIVLNSSFP